MRIFAIILILFSLNVSALSLQQAKNQGLIGEMNNGYVGAVQANIPSSVKQLIKRTNDLRKQNFSKLAQQNNLSVNQVASQFAQKAKQRLTRGQYYQSGNGSWTKK